MFLLQEIWLMLRLCYAYNEKLPKKTAHDVYVYHNCFSLASIEEVEMRLAAGKAAMSLQQLDQHYGIRGLNETIIEFLPMVRKSSFLSISWNLPFFMATQQWLKKSKPDVALFSVFKQGVFHLKRKIPGIKYVYEVHDLAWYPGQKSEKISEKVEIERQMLERCDLVTVTTSLLKEILENSPYKLQTAIKVIPLGVSAEPLPPMKTQCKTTLHLAYVGQLMTDQGIDLLLEAISSVSDVQLDIIGGKPFQIEAYQAKVDKMGMKEKVHFLGFLPPDKIAGCLGDVDAFIAGFLPDGRMPYTARTKVLEYAAWQRPIIVPDFPSIKEHLQGGKGALFYIPGDIRSLAMQIEEMKKTECRKALYTQLLSLYPELTWSFRSRQYIKALRSII